MLRINFIYPGNTRKYDPIDVEYVFFFFFSFSLINRDSRIYALISQEIINVVVKCEKRI